MLSSLFFAILGLVVGASLYLTVINRILSYMRRSVSKHLVSITLPIILMSSFAWLGYSDGWMGRWAIALAFLAVTMGEAYRIWMQRQHIGAPPVARLGPKPSIVRPITTTDLTVLHYIVPMRSSNQDNHRVGSCRSAEQRLRVAHISDLHVNDRLGRNYYHEVIEKVNQTEPDLVLITGDFITELEFVHWLPDLLSPIRSRYGAYAILGNHDHWAGAAEVSRAVCDAGVELIGNGYRKVPLNDHSGLTLMGCEEPWSPDRWSPPDETGDDLILALSHSADQVYRLSQAGADAVFSGHYHAGQFQLPLLGPMLVPSRFGRRFYHGHFVIGKTHLFVSAGAGASSPALRLYCPPDVILVDFCLAPPAK